MKEILRFKDQLSKSFQLKLLLLLIGILLLPLIVLMVQKQQIFISRASINLSEAFEIKDADGNIVTCTSDYVCEVATSIISLRLRDPSILFVSENGRGCSGDDCYAPTGSRRVSLTNLYSGDPSNSDSFLADCGQSCVYPIYKIPYIYDQTNVSIPESDQYFDKNIDAEQRICVENTKNNAGSSACGPTSLAMVAESFNGHDNNSQTANNLTRYFLYKKIMDCDRGTVDIDASGNRPGLLKYLELATQTEIDTTLQIRVLDRVEGSFEELEKWYKDSGYPIWTGVFIIRSNGTKGLHYGTIAGISDNFVWLADPYRPAKVNPQDQTEKDGQTVLKIPRQDFIKNHYRNKFWKIAPVTACPPSEVPGPAGCSRQIESVSNTTSCPDVCYSTDLRTNVGKDSSGECNASISSTSHLCTSSTVGSKMRCNNIEYQCVDRGTSGGLFWTGTGY